MWTILKKFKKSGRTYYEVRCECGYIGIRRADHVESGRTTCCRKCSAKNTYKKYGSSCIGAKDHRGIGDITKTFWNRYVYGASKRYIELNITLEYAWKLYLQQRGKCALSGVPIKFSTKNVGSNPDYSNITASLDRIDSTKGYVHGNVQWVHKVVNYIKRDLPEKEFIEWCHLIHANHELSSVKDLRVAEKVQRLIGEEVNQ